MSLVNAFLEKVITFAYLIRKKGTREKVLNIVKDAMKYKATMQDVTNWRQVRFTIRAFAFALKLLIIQQKN